MSDRQTEDTLRLLHEQLIAGDPTAPAAIAEAVIGPLVNRLGNLYPRLRESDSLADAAADAVLNYIKRPEQFDPDRGSLIGYLLISARGDLFNALRKERRWTKTTVPLESVELPAVPGNVQMEGDVDAHRFGPEIAKLFDDPRDRKLAELVIDGERATGAYAEILGIEELPIEEQRRTVKQHKDRIKKRLTRYGESIR